MTTLINTNCLITRGSHPLVAIFQPAGWEEKFDTLYYTLLFMRNECTLFYYLLNAVNYNHRSAKIQNNEDFLYNVYHFIPEYME